MSKTPRRTVQRASQIKQFIIDTNINGDDPIEAFRRIFNEKTTDINVRAKIRRMKEMDLYKRMEPAITNSFIQEVTDETKKAAVNYMKKYNSMLEEGDKFIRDSEGEMKLKAFANQRALMEANPFKLVQQMQDVNNQKSLPSGDDDVNDIIID